MRQLIKASLALLFLISITVAFAATASAQQLRIVHIDVGQGDATHATGPRPNHGMHPPMRVQGCKYGSL